MLRKFMTRPVVGAACLLLTLAFSRLQTPLRAQFTQQPQPLGVPHGIPDASGRRGDSEDPQAREMVQRLQKKRNDARQQEIVKDTTKLLALATELKTDVDKTDKNTLSIDVIRKAEEIEKLAKTVKERMKD